MQPIVRKRIIRYYIHTPLEITISFYGKSTAQEREDIISEIINTITEQRIYWSDTMCYHYSFDYKLPCGEWCECIHWNNELDKIYCSVNA